MQTDDIIWEVINKSFCSFKTTFNGTKFCRNEYNVTGVCNKVSCPLANSRYATVREEQGVCYLYIKTVERSHTPAKLWEKIKLDPNFMKSIETIDENMEYWPSHMIHRVKQRYIKITQYLIRMRKLRKQIKRELVPINKRSEQRDSKREQKAVVAAQLTVNIKKELLDRLNKSIHGDKYQDLISFPQEILNEVMEKEGVPDEMHEESDIEDEEDEELEMEENGDVEYVEDDDDDEYEEYEQELDEYRASQSNNQDYDDDDDEDEDDEEQDDSEDDYEPKGNSNKRTISKSHRKSGAVHKKPVVSIEYEPENDTPQQQRQRN